MKKETKELISDLLKNYPRLNVRGYDISLSCKDSFLEGEVSVISIAIYDGDDALYGVDFKICYYSQQDVSGEYLPVDNDRIYDYTDLCGVLDDVYKDLVHVCDMFESYDVQNDQLWLDQHGYTYDGGTDSYYVHGEDVTIYIYCKIASMDMECIRPWIIEVNWGDSKRVFNDWSLQRCFEKVLQ